MDDHNSSNPVPEKRKLGKSFKSIAKTNIDKSDDNQKVKVKYVKLPDGRVVRKVKRRKIDIKDNLKSKLITRENDNKTTVSERSHKGSVTDIKTAEEKNASPINLKTTTFINKSKLNDTKENIKDKIQNEKNHKIEITKNRQSDANSNSKLPTNERVEKQLIHKLKQTSNDSDSDSDIFSDVASDYEPQADLNFEKKQEDHDDQMTQSVINESDLEEDIDSSYLPSNLDAKKLVLLSKKIMKWKDNNNINFNDDDYEANFIEGEGRWGEESEDD